MLQAVHRADSHEFPHVLWKLKVYYSVNKSPPLVHTLSHTNPLIILPSFFFKFHINVILSSKFPSSNWSFSYRISGPKTLYAFLISPLYITCLAHLIVLDLITLIIFGDL